MAKHPHHDLIVEWAADTSRVVQFRSKGDGKWHSADMTVLLNIPDLEYRFKPEPKPDVVTYFVLINNPAVPSIKCAGSNLKAVFDGETGKLIKAEVIE